MKRKTEIGKLRAPYWIGAGVFLSVAVFGGRGFLHDEEPLAASASPENGALLALADRVDVTALRPAGDGAKASPDTIALTGDAERDLEAVQQVIADSRRDMMARLGGRSMEERRTAMIAWEEENGELQQLAADLSEKIPPIPIFDGDRTAEFRERLTASLSAEVQEAAREAFSAQDAMRLRMDTEKHTMEERRAELRAWTSAHGELLNRIRAPKIPEGVTLPSPEQSSAFMAKRRRQMRLDDIRPNGHPVANFRSTNQQIKRSL